MSSESIKLSVIVPFFNMSEGDKCRFTMDRLVDQTLDENGISYEILAIDDCSTDDTYSILKEYERLYPDKVRAFKTEYNMKQGGARNLGLANARGEWIGFMDGDDWPAPDMYEKMLNKAMNTGADVVGCDLHQVYEHTMDIGSIVNANTIDQTGALDEERYKKLVLNPCSMVIKIYRAEVIKKNHLYFPEGMFYEDNVAAPVWMLSCKHFEKVEEPLYYYYQIPGSTTHHISISKCDDRLKAGMMLLEEFRNRNWYEKYKDELEASFTKLYYANTLFSYMPGVKRTSSSYTANMRKGLLENFPEFDKNKYFEEAYDAEEKKLMRLHKKSNLLFYWYYKALWFYRKVRYR